MKKFLVCEGECNRGRVQQFDAEVRTAKYRENIRTSTLDLAHQFNYTQHVEAATNEYACSACGTERQFGKDLRF